jgi:hypothetical protein
MDTIVLIARICLVAGLALFALAFWKLRTFRLRVNVLRTKEDLRAFRDVAKLNMYAALTLIPLWGIFFLLIPLTLGGLARHSSVVALFSTLGMGPAMLLLSLGVLKEERSVQRTPAATDELAAERDRVVHVWLKKPFPDW